MKQINNCIDGITFKTPSANTTSAHFFINFFNKLSSVLWIWQQRARERHHLQQLSDHMLQDMGLSRADISIEVNKPFWHA